jgi:hypothetical protein
LAVASSGAGAIAGLTWRSNSSTDCSASMGIASPCSQ